jgi:dipeptidyl aminopeptidase/acylaminoacyl peptidase
MHGDRDRTVPISQSELLNSALKKAGVDVTFVVVEGAAHADRNFGSPRVIEQVAAFFEKQLKK